MFGRHAKKMTEDSGHYLDWSRTGELLLSASHRYSRDELLTRGFIVATIAVFAYLGAALNDKEKTHCSSTAVAVMAGFLGFVISHAIVIIPLVQKRREMARECSELAEQITSQTCSNDLYAQAVFDLVQHILKLSLSTDQHGNASLTWGTRKRLLQCVKDRLDEGKQDPDFWQGPMDQLIEKIQNTKSALRYR